MQPTTLLTAWISNSLRPVSVEHRGEGRVVGILLERDGKAVTVFSLSRGDSSRPSTLSSTPMNQMVATVWLCKQVHHEVSKEKD